MEEKDIVATAKMRNDYFSKLAGTNANGEPNCIVTMFYAKPEGLEDSKLTLGACKVRKVENENSTTFYLKFKDTSSAQQLASTLKIRERVLMNTDGAGDGNEFLLMLMENEDYVSDYMMLYSPICFAICADHLGLPADTIMITAFNGCIMLKADIETIDNPYYSPAEVDLTNSEEDTEQSSGNEYLF